MRKNATTWWRWRRTVRRGPLGRGRIEVNQTYPLKDAAQAHRDLEARKTVGSTVLIV
jgi:NADPH:quinone reductase-like Zn-dependent oxidoreductase